METGTSAHTNWPEKKQGSTWEVWAGVKAFLKFYKQGQGQQLMECHRGKWQPTRERCVPTKGVSPDKVLSLPFTAEQFW